MIDPRIKSLEAVLDERANNFDLARHGPLSADELVEIESTLGVSIPSSYRQILEHIGPFDDDGGLEVARPNLDHDVISWLLAYDRLI